jgi:hypothetical protein
MAMMGYNRVDCNFSFFVRIPLPLARNGWSSRRPYDSGWARNVITPQQSTGGVRSRTRRAPKELVFFAPFCADFVTFFLGHSEIPSVTGDP